MTLQSLTGFERHYDGRRFAQWIYDPSTLTFWSYDDPVIAWSKAVYIDFRVPGGLGGAVIWAFKDDDTNGTLVKTLARGLRRK